MNFIFQERNLFESPAAGFDVSKLCRLEERLYAAARFRTYTRLSAEELKDFLTRAMEVQLPNGLVPLCRDPHMPGDARVQFLWHPT